jgi:N12 class adenine-specific DNA methylase
MKEIVTEKVSKYTVYQAIDGTKFDSKDECVAYEKTVECVLLTRYNQLIDKSDSEINMFGLGSDEYRVDRLHPLKSDKDVETIVQLYSYYNPNRSEKEYDDTFFKLNKCLQEQDILFVGRGYNYDNNKDLYIFFTYKEYCAKLLE